MTASVKRQNLTKYLLALQEQLRRVGRKELLRFTFATMPTFAPAGFHKTYYRILTDFAEGKIKKLMVFMPPQHGKALRVDTQVLTCDRGFVNHGDLKVGDYVFSPEGKPVKVLWTSGSYEWECRRLTFAHGEDIIAAYNHEWGVYIPDTNHVPRFYPRMETDEIMRKMSEGDCLSLMCTASLADDDVSVFVGETKKHFIKSIVPCGTHMVNCIEVEGGYYLAGRELRPTHNSEGSTRRLPAFLLGRNPDLRLAIVSYSATKAKKFNKEIQRIIDTEEYRGIFPNTRLDDGKGEWMRSADECEIVGKNGGFKTVGVGGALTGDPVDILIMDDIYKNASSAWSATVRESISDWYDTVAETRLHNDSQQLIVFTRWHQDDLAGRLLEQQGIYDEVENPDGWQVVVYQAIKQGAPTEYDPRQEGEPLWKERHSLEKLDAVRQRNPHVFESLYQQNPQPVEGLMYEMGFAEYSIKPATMRCKRKAYIDTADTGEDYLCQIIYDETENANYIVDVLYTQRPMEYTEVESARRLTKFGVAECIVESNNGGRGFSRNVEKQCRLLNNNKTHFTWFHQRENKDARIFSHSADVQNLCVMPTGWQRLFPEFSSAILGYLKTGTNAHDDAPDALTGTVEKRQKERTTDVASLFGR